MILKYSLSWDQVHLELVSKLSLQLIFFSFTYNIQLPLVVYKVRRLADNKPYVIKNVRIIDLSRREQAEAINEVQILAQLDSAYVVKYYDSFIEKDCLFIGMHILELTLLHNNRKAHYIIVMEFCNRGDLQNLLKKAKERKVTCLKESVIWNIVLQVILGYLNSHINSSSNSFILVYRNSMYLI